MNKKYSLFLALLTIVALFAVGCASQPSATVTPTATAAAEPTPTGTPEATETTAVSTPTAAPEATTAELSLTLDELAQYNGKDGKPAYIAVDGVIYDVTNNPAWKQGQHNGFEAGKDLTKEIKEQSPHGVSKLEGVTVVGKIKE